MREEHDGLTAYPASNRSADTKEAQPVREEFTLSDMQTYGAEDAEELASILDAIDRALGTTDDHRVDRGPDWARVLQQPTREVDGISPLDIPTTPGVHVWFYDGEPVFVGEALGKKGLRGRIRVHLAEGSDLSHSTFRASVAVELLRIGREAARSRPSIIRPVQLSVINEWVRECELSWLEFGSPTEAHAFKTRLREAWLPRLNTR